jgi:hypothetical protein
VCKEQNVAMMVLLIECDGELCLAPGFASELAQLGVTNIALVRDDQTVGVVVEGWLLDPALSAGAVANVVGARSGVRTLHPVMEMAVSNAAHQGGHVVEDTPIPQD